MEWYNALVPLEKTYLIVGIVGAIVFTIQFILSMLGGDAGDAASADAGLETGSDVDFQLLSIQGISVFFLMFGVVGLSMSRSGAGTAIAMVSAFGAGALSMFLVAKMFALFRSMQSSGTLDLNTAVGEEARVYLTIKAGSTGQIEVTIQGRQGIYDAVSNSKVNIPTDARVKVVGVANNRFIVETLSEK